MKDRDIVKLIEDYIVAVEKLYGTPLKACLSLIMVTGFYMMLNIAVVSLGMVSYNIYHIPLSQPLLSIFNSIIFPIVLPIVRFVIALQIISILLGFVFWLGRERESKKVK